MDKWVWIKTADKERENYYWVRACLKNYPVSRNVIVLWENEYRPAFESYDGKGLIVAIPSTLGGYNHEFMPVFDVVDFYRRRIIPRKINYVYTGGHGPGIPSNLRKALAEEELLLKILEDEGFEAYHVYMSGWGLANPPPPQRYTVKKEIHVKSKFDIEIHDNGQARKLIDVVGVEPNFRRTPSYRISTFDPKLFDDKRRAKIYLAWSLNYSLSIFAIVQTIKIRNRAIFDMEYQKGLLNDMWQKKVRYFPKEVIDLITSALENKKITHKIRDKYGMPHHFADLFKFADDLYKKDMADFQLIDLRANRRLFDKTHIPLKEISTRAISPDEL